MQRSLHNSGENMDREETRDTKGVSRRDFLARSGSAVICGAMGAGILSGKASANTHNAPVNRTRGTGWKELRAGICRIMEDYCGEYRTEEVLRHGLQWLDSIGESEAANAYARKPHELMRTMECQTQITLGQLVMHACIAAENADQASGGGLKKAIMGLVMKMKGGEMPPPEMLAKFQRGHYITVKKENGTMKTGVLPFRYWLKPPFAPTYEENYQRHCAL